jgi:ribosomal protein S18 acetylase RimI-like enzyme
MTNTPNKPSTPIPYSHRLATTQDINAIAPLMIAFAQERATADPSIQIKPNYDFEKYVSSQLEKSNSNCWLLEYKDPENPSSKPIVGFFFIYVYDEKPPANLPEYLREKQEQENPFIPRRVGSVLGLYVHPKHRTSQGIKLLVDAGLKYAETMKITDIDVLITAEQTGLHSFLERLGFTKAAIQYTRHYDIPPGTELPDIHPPYPEIAEVPLPEPSAIALRDPSNNELVYNSQGKPVFLIPLRDENGNLLLSSSKIPIYPLPLRDPQTNEWVFDPKGELVTCPILRDEKGEIFEHRNIVQFHPPVYQIVNGSISLKKDTLGKYVFCDVERDKGGNMIKSPEGLPIFKQQL